MAKELLESLMALHGAALEQILTITSQTGETGESLIRKFGGDQLISSLLLLRMAVSASLRICELE